MSTTTGVQDTVSSPSRVASTPGKRPASAERLTQLDALRGLAALTVIFGHFFTMMRPEGFRAPHAIKDFVHTGIPTKDSWLALFELPPLRLLVAGHEAVVLFFVLSGFVLCLQFDRNSTNSYPVYVAKRACRIYLPYLAALVIAVLLSLYVPAGPIPALNSWFNQTWSHPILPADVINHVVMLGSYNHDKFNTAFWSLIHEMRISLLFPLLMVAVRLRVALATGIFAGFSVTGLALDHFFGAATGDALITIHYVGLFGIGALLAKYRRPMGVLWGRLSKLQRGMIIAAAVGLYCCGTYSRYPLQTENLNVRDIPIGLGAALILACALYSPPFVTFLRRPLLQAIGRISYSLYLVHASVLFTLVHLTYGRIEFWVLFLIYVPSSILAACLLYRWVERPSIAAGRWIESRTAGSQLKETLVASHAQA